MGTFTDIEEAREYFKKERFATSNGMVLDDMTDDTATCSLKVNDTHQNALGNVMGGAIFTLADFAFAVLANQLHLPTVAAQININYLSIPKGDELTAVARLRKNGQRTSIINVDVTDSMGRDIAQFTGTGFKL